MLAALNVKPNVAVRNDALTSPMNTPCVIRPADRPFTTIAAVSDLS
jgi:hypothetical protein